TVGAVAGRGDGPVVQPQHAGDSVAAGNGVLDTNVPGPPRWLQAAGSKLAAEVDHEIVVARVQQHRDHLVECVPLGDAAQVKRQVTVSLGNVRVASRKAEPVALRCCTAPDRPKAPSGHQWS